MGGTGGKTAHAAAGKAGGACTQPLFFSGARNLECDKQGRFLVPANLRVYAGLECKGDVVLAGADDRIEVWNKELWHTYCSEVEPDVTAMAASLSDFSI